MRKWRASDSTSGDTVIVSIRRLVTDDAEAYREVRLAALRDAPGAFGSTYEREAGLGPDNWTSRLENRSRAVFVAEEDGEILGLAVGAPDDEDAGAGFLLSMWVDPRGRGRGHGDALVQAVVLWLMEAGYGLIRLHVTDGNNPAAGLYRRNGFIFSGRHLVRDRDGVRELEMVRVVTEPSVAGG